MSCNVTSQAVLGLAFLTFSQLVLAGTFSVNPVRLTLSTDTPSAMLTLRNQGGKETIVQVEAKSWMMRDGTDVLEPTTDLIVVPPLFSLAPGGFQVVRIGLRRPPDRAVELNYRLLLREVPPEPEIGFKGAQIALTISLPVFVEPPGGAKPRLQWRLARNQKGGVSLQLENSGNGHVQVKEFSLIRSGTAERLDHNVPAYLIPGQSREWQLESDMPNGRWKLLARTDVGTLEAELLLESN